MVRKHARRCTTSQDATNTVIKKQSRKKFAHSRCYLQRRGNRQNAKLEWAIFRPPVLSAVQCARVVVVAYCCVQEGRQKVIILKLMNVSSQRICLFGEEAFFPSWRGSRQAKQTWRPFDDPASSSPLRCALIAHFFFLNR